MYKKNILTAFQVRKVTVADTWIFYKGICRPCIRMLRRQTFHFASGGRKHRRMLVSLIQPDALNH